MRFSCDFVFLCFKVLTFYGSAILFLISFGCWRQLIVFLCSFFFLAFKLFIDSVLKIFKFLISMLILILLVWVFGFGVTARLITLRIYLVGECSLVYIFKLADFLLGVKNFLSFVNWQYFSLKLLFGEVSCLLFVRLCVFMFKYL